jgi:serine/threonine protein phosphatase PrpC
MRVALKLQSKKDMEDYHNVQSEMPNHRGCTFVGLFDGHGGDQTSKWLSENLWRYLDEGLCGSKFEMFCLAPSRHPATSDDHHEGSASLHGATVGSYTETPPDGSISSNRIFSRPKSSSSDDGRGPIWTSGADFLADRYDSTGTSSDGALLNKHTHQQKMNLLIANGTSGNVLAAIDEEESFAGGVSGGSGSMPIRVLPAPAAGPVSTTRFIGENQHGLLSQDDGKAGTSGVSPIILDRRDLDLLFGSPSLPSSSSSSDSGCRPASVVVPTQSASFRKNIVPGLLTAYSSSSSSLSSSSSSSSLSSCSSAPTSIPSNDGLVVFNSLVSEMVVRACLKADADYRQKTRPPGRIRFVREFCGLENAPLEDSRQDLDMDRFEWDLQWGIPWQSRIDDFASYTATPGTDSSGSCAIFALFAESPSRRLVAAYEYEAKKVYKNHVGDRTTTDRRIWLEKCTDHRPLVPTQKPDVGLSFVIGNVGDSRALLIRGGETVALSQDHRPEFLAERLRIEGAGGRVEWGRIDGFAMSRAFGDYNSKFDALLAQDQQRVIPVPELVQEYLVEDDMLLLICDGIVERLKNEEVGNFVWNARLDGRTDVDIVTCLIRFAHESGSRDNLSAILVTLKKDAMTGVPPTSFCAVQSSKQAYDNPGDGRGENQFE